MTKWMPLVSSLLLFQPANLEYRYLLQKCIPTHLYIFVQIYLTYLNMNEHFKHFSTPPTTSTFSFTSLTYSLPLPPSPPRQAILTPPGTDSSPSDQNGKRTRRRPCAEPAQPARHGPDAGVSAAYFTPNLTQAQDAEATKVWRYDGWLGEVSRGSDPQKGLKKILRNLRFCCCDARTPMRKILLLFLHKKIY